MLAAADAGSAGLDQLLHVPLVLQHQSVDQLKLVDHRSSQHSSQQCALTGSQPPDPSTKLVWIRSSIRGTITSINLLKRPLKFLVKECQGVLVKMTHMVVISGECLIWLSMTDCQDLQCS